MSVRDKLINSLFFGWVLGAILSGIDWEFAMQTLMDIPVTLAGMFL